MGYARENSPLRLVKQCENNISQLLADDFAGYSMKPKIMSIMTSILVTIALNFFYFSAFKKR